MVRRNSEDVTRFFGGLRSTAAALRQPFTKTLDVPRHSTDLLFQLSYLALEGLVAAAQLVSLTSVALVRRDQLAGVTLQSLEATAQRLVLFLQAAILVTVAADLLFDAFNLLASLRLLTTCHVSVV